MHDRLFVEVLLGKLRIILAYLQAIRKMSTAMSFSLKILDRGRVLPGRTLGTVENGS